MGIDVCLLDLSPINLHAFAQQGFHTVAGDARDPQVLQRADAPHCGLAVVGVPDDEVAHRTSARLAGLNPTAAILVRCRYQANIDRAEGRSERGRQRRGGSIRCLNAGGVRFVRSAPEPGRQDFVDGEENQ